MKRELFRELSETSRRSRTFLFRFLFRLLRTCSNFPPSTFRREVCISKSERNESRRILETSFSLSLLHLPASSVCSYHIDLVELCLHLLDSLTPLLTILGLRLHLFHLRVSGISVVLLELQIQSPPLLPTLTLSTIIITITNLNTRKRLVHLSNRFKGDLRKLRLLLSNNNNNK